MTIFKKNSNYIENGENNMEFINEIVDKIMEEEINHTPCDYICRNIGSTYPQANHKVLEIPGEFKNLENAYGFKLNGRSIYMDGVESVFIKNGETIKEYATCIEYLTTDFNPKSDKIFDYDLSIIIQLRKFCYNIIVTHIIQKEKEKTFYIDGHPVRVLFRVFDKERISKILNTLSKKDYTNNKISDEDVVKFGYSIAFAKDDYAKDHLEKCAELFASIEKIDQPQRIDLFKALKEKIKYHFNNDKSKKKDLITMISQAMYKQDFDKLSREEKMEFKLKQLEDAVHYNEEELSQQKAKISQQKVELSQQKAELSQQKAALSQQKAKISQQKAKISQQDELILQLKKELASFKNAS